MRYIGCIGNFDGVHLGHQKLIKETVALARKCACMPIAITFDRNLENEITNLKQKEELLYQYGIEEVIILPFDKEFQLIPPDKFIEYFLNQFELQYLLCGPDWRFGNRASGDVKYLLDNQERNFEVKVIDEELYEGRKISSSWIRELIKSGDKELASKLLNRDLV